MTATAGPGISLMGEFTGLAYYAETPAVIFDVQRVGPSTGLPTRTAQGDLLSTAFLSHGDTKHIMLLPVVGRGVLRDGDGGVRSRRAVPDAGVRDAGPRPRHEQLDVDAVQVPDKADQPRQAADGRGARSELGAVGPLQGRRRRRHSVPHDSRRRHAGVFHARIGPQREGRSTASGRTTTSRTWIGWRASSRRRASSCRSRRSTPWPDAKIGFIGFGTSHWAITESRDQLREETDVKTSYFRLRAYPFNDELSEFIDAHERIYVVEQNRDAQLLQLMKLELTPERARSCAACCTTTACRSTPAASPTTCWRRRASRSRRKTCRTVEAGWRHDGRRVSQWPAH